MLALAGPALTAVKPVLVSGELCHPRNLLVKLDAPTRMSQLERDGWKILRKMPEIDYVVIQTPDNTLQRSRMRLQSEAGVLQVDLDRAAEPAYDPNDPMWPNQWHSRAINANLAWDTTKGDPSVVVAVIDTGVFMQHEDLAANIWTNPNEIGGNGTDDDHNGYIDDVHGWDFVNNDNDPSDDFGHGTACAGLVAAVQDNSLGVSGVAPHCRVMPLKAATSSGYFFDSATVPAYLYAANNGAKVLSMSYFADHVSPAEEDALKYCVAHGVLPVAAAGNSNFVFPYYPGGYECVLSVAALDGNLNKAGFSDFGSWVDVSCPGVGLATTTADGAYTTGFAGTSGACPQVAGVAALCFSANPSATPEEVRDAIEDTAVLQNQAPFGEFSNYGLVDAKGAVMRILGGSVTAHPPVVRYMTSLGGTSPSTIGPHPHVIIVPPFPPSLQIAPSRIYGRGFGPGHSVLVTCGGAILPLVSKTRDYIDTAVSLKNAPINVLVDGSLVAAIPATGLNARAWPLTEASTQDGTLTGGFFDTIAADARVMNVTRQSDGSFLVQGTFRMVGQPLSLKLIVRRQYTGTTLGTETLQLYDWTSASYPYGSFVNIASTAAPSTMTTGTWTVPNPAKYSDFDGTVYFQLVTSTDFSSDAQLKLDQVLLTQ